MSDPIRLVISPPFAEIVLERPERRNALSIAMWDAIAGLVEQAVRASEAKVVLLHGGGTGAFAAGADISEFATIYATRESAAASGRTIAQALEAIERCPKPVIAAIDGPCVGGGVSLAMAADLRIASRTASFGVTPARLGLVYPASDTRRLLQVIGPSATKRLLMTGAIIDAAAAHDLGLVDQLADEPSALPAARTLGREISAVSQWSTRAIKQMIAGLQGGWAEDGPEAEALFLDGFEHEDFQEGHRAFLEKRPARFSFE